jgi:hypothetical protein
MPSSRLAGRVVGSPFVNQFGAMLDYDSHRLRRDYCQRTIGQTPLDGLAPKPSFRWSRRWNSWATPRRGGCWRHNPARESVARVLAR